MPSTTERFVSNPTNLDISRSKFNLNHKNTLTFNPGELVPILAYSDVIPGDTFKMDVSFVCRSTTPIAPVMDDAYIQVEFYFVPHKLVLSRAYMSPQLDDSNRSFAAIIGAQDSLLNMPLPDDDLNLPSIYADYSSMSSSDYLKSPLHYLGYPFIADCTLTASAGSDTDIYANPLPALALYAVWNENYRDPNLWQPVTFSIDGNGDVIFSNNYYAGIKNFGDYGLGKCVLPSVCREHGYFGSALPWPQRNSTTVTLPLGETANVVAGTLHALGDELQFGTSTGMVGGNQYALTISSASSGATSGTVGVSSSASASPQADINGINLVTDLSTATAASINTLRYAIQLQRLYEAWARGGNRIQDLTQIFGVTPHDMGDDKPLYLGGKRVPLNITQVTNTAGTTYSTATQQSVGSTGAFSNTSDSDHYFTHSFDTWGTIIGVCLVRHHDSIPNGFSKMLQRKNRLDFYWPQFANLGEQPVYLREICAGMSSGDNPWNGTIPDRVFGYQEAYAEYRYLPDRTTGAVNSEFGSIAYWTYGTNFTNLSGASISDVTLNDWLDAKGQQDEFDQTLQVSSETAGFTFLAQFYFDITAIRPMPLYSIPGLMDHH